MQRRQQSGTPEPIKLSKPNPSEALMTFNQDILNTVVNEAKAKAAGNTRWLNAINKAVEGLRGGWIVTELANCLLITTESGETYRANGVCQCKAFSLNQPCKHRAAAQIVKRYNEAV